MSDSLTIFGTDYTGVTGIKATGTGNGQLTYIRPAGTKSITANGTGIDVTEYASVNVSVASGGVNIPTFTIVFDSSWSTVQSITCDKTLEECRALIRNSEYNLAAVSYGAAGSSEHYPLTAHAPYANLQGSITYIVFDTMPYPIYDLTYNSDGTITITEPSSYVVSHECIENGTYRLHGYVYDPIIVNVPSATPTLQSKTATPSTSSQTITADQGYDGLSSVQINAMPSGSVSASATKGAVSNHSISVTPKATVGTAGYLAAGDTTGTAVSVSASELVSGTLSITSSGTKDVTNYASASIAASDRTASATKGTVSNHQVSITPVATTTAGFVNAGNTNGTPVTVQASELVSGNLALTDNTASTDCTNYATVSVAIPFVTYYTSSSSPTSSQGSNGDIWLVTTA